MAKNYVKAIFGTIVSDDFILQEGQVGATERPALYTEMVEKGLVFMSEDEAAVRSFKYKTGVEMFTESFPSLNPREGVKVGPSVIDFKELCPLKNAEGKPANYIETPVQPIAPPPAPDMSKAITPENKTEKK
jgi:hypothetical protein